MTDGQLRLAPGVPVDGEGARGMNIADLFIRRPVTTTLVMLAILLFGVVAYRALPVSDLPNVDFPTLLVTASLPGREPGDDGRRRSPRRSRGSSRPSPASTR